MQKIYKLLIFGEKYICLDAMNRLWYSVDYLYHLFDIKKSVFCPRNVFILFV